MYKKSLPASDGLLISVVILMLFVFFLWYVIEVSTESSVSTSTEGGILTEGIVGTPRFVNPVLAVTRADKDLSALIYSGLMRLNTDGVLAPDIAESVTVSEDGLIYNIVLKQNTTFHDGTPLTADDVIFTVTRIKEPALASPLRANFDGVTVEKISDYELNFVLTEPYVPFVENLTFGILPAHIWKDARNEEFPFSQHNSEPIGTGPYKVKNIKRNTSGIPDSYTLEPHNAYHNAVPKISELVLNFYPNEELAIEAFNTGKINSIAALDASYISSLTLNMERTEIITTPLPRTFAIFFNQNKSAVLRDEAARKALNAAIDRDELIGEVLGGYGQPIYGPIPPGFGVETTKSTSTTGTSTPFDTARKILRDGGWKTNNETGIWEKEIDDFVTPLVLSIATANNEIFESTAEYVRAQWEKLGAQVVVRQYEQTDLTQAIIRPREYEALLFGTVVGRPLDFYSFWHSSQRNDPGLNVALYANITADSILSEARTSASTTVAVAYEKFAKEIESDTPAVFLYVPELIYIHPKALTNVTLNGVSELFERFSNISDWSMETDSVWEIFND